MMLFEPPEGRSFYISDNPVCLSNTLMKRGSYGNIGFGLPGIEIYLPLSANLMLACWCPTILKFLKTEMTEARNLHALNALNLVQKQIFSTSKMKQHMDEFDSSAQNIEDMFKAKELGTVAKFTIENMDYVNSLQMIFAREFVICKDGDFELARRFMKDHPDHNGLRFS